MLRGRKPPALAEERYGVKYHNLSNRCVRIYPELGWQSLLELSGITVVDRILIPGDCCAEPVKAKNT